MLLDEPPEMPRTRDDKNLQALRIKLGLRIKQARKGLALSQEDLCERVGLGSAVTLSRLETGAKSTSLGTLARIAGAMNLTLAELFDFDAELPRSKKQRPVKYEAEIVRIVRTLDEPDRTLLLKIARRIAR